MDISNGLGTGVALFVQGCTFKCKGCFNEETWNFSGGKEWTVEVEEKFLSLLDNPRVSRVSILGGEPLHPTNMNTIKGLLLKIKVLYPQKRIWLYSGYTYDDTTLERQSVMQLADVLVDGLFIEELADMKLSFAGSSNQRVIDMNKTLRTGSVCILETN